jgi:hypothetical protein
VIRSERKKVKKLNHATKHIEVVVLGAGIKCFEWSFLELLLFAEFGKRIRSLHATSLDQTNGILKSHKKEVWH